MQSTFTHQKTIHTKAFFNKKDFPLPRVSLNILKVYLSILIYSLCNHLIEFPHIVGESEKGFNWNKE